MKKSNLIIVGMVLFIMVSVFNSCKRSKYEPFNKGMKTLFDKNKAIYGGYNVDSMGGAYVANELIVNFADSTPDSIVQKGMDALGANSWESCNCQNNLALAVFDSEAAANIGIMAFEGKVNVTPPPPTEMEGVERNYYMSDDILPSNSELVGSPLTRNSNHVGQFVVAVLDAGLDVTVSVKEKLYKSDSSCLGSDQMGWNFVDKNNLLSDDHSHGTFVSSLIARTADENADYSLLPVKVQNYQGVGTLFTFLCGLEYAVNTRKAKVVNISMGYTAVEPSEFLIELIQNAPNTVFVTSTGNEGVKLDTVNHYPSDLDLANIIRVATHVGNKDSLRLASFSNFYDTEFQTIATHGTDVLGSTPLWFCPDMTTASSQMFTNRNCVSTAKATKDGTSFSTAIVTGKIIDIIASDELYNSTAIDIIYYFDSINVSSGVYRDRITNTTFSIVN